MGKVVDFGALVENAQKLKQQGKKIVLCHGCFDLMHPGHIKHFQSAKRMGDVLMVTITPDEYVDKGSARPAFNQKLRVESIAALECVDFAAVNKWATAEKTLRTLKPDIYAKGQEFKNGEDKTGKLQKELKVLEEIGARIQVTNEVVFSSTELLSKYFLNKE